jgi:hypothetical protein
MSRRYIRITEYEETVVNEADLALSFDDAMTILAGLPPVSSYQNPIEPVPFPVPAPSPVATQDVDALVSKYPGMDIADDVADWNNGKWGTNWAAFVAYLDTRFAP